MCGWSKLHSDVRRRKQTAYLEISLSLLRAHKSELFLSYLPCWQLLLKPQLYCPAHSPPLPPTQVADTCWNTYSAPLHKTTAFAKNKSNLNVTVTKTKQKTSTIGYKKCRENSSPFAEITKIFRTLLLLESEAGLKPCEVKRFPERTVDSELLTCPPLLIGPPTGPGYGSEMDKSIGRK